MLGPDGAAPAAHGVADDAQAQTRAAHGPGAILVHPVEPLEYVLHVLVGDADAVVLHGDHHGVADGFQGGVDKAHGAGILDAVFHEVIENLVDVVLGGPDHGVLVRLIGQGDLLFPGHHPQHTDHPLQHPGHGHRIGRVLDTAVQPGQAQQVLGDAAEPLGLPANVLHKFPGGVGVHVLRLKDGVRQQADTGQGRFQLVAGVGHKAAAGGLGGLQAVRQAVELRGQLGDLVISPDGGPMAVGPLPDLTDGLEQLPDLPGEGPGQQSAEGNHQNADQQGDAGQVGLEALQQLRLLGVVFIGVHRADDAVAVYHRGSAPA